MLEPDGTVRMAYVQYGEWLDGVSKEFMIRKNDQADMMFKRLGITFTVYGDDSSTERMIPFDIIPRIIDPNQWDYLSCGAIQRVDALNAFLDDIYHDQAILKAGRIPKELVLNNDAFRPEMLDLDLPKRVYGHIAGVDLVCTGERDFFVLEDNVRTPSGVSYMLENRQTMMRLFPELFSMNNIAPVERFASELCANLKSVAPLGVDDPTIVLLTPGRFNSAFFEHAFLATEMGIELVEGQDLFVNDGLVFMRTTEGPKRIDVIYRRIDDDFIDSLAFRSVSMLGVPGLLSVIRRGRVTFTNAIGTGVADDKAMYVYSRSWDTELP